MLSSQDFDNVCQLLRDECAIALDPGKEYLVETRLSPLVQELELSSIGELLVRNKTYPSHGLTRLIVEALVTGETFFFRDQTPFEEMRTTVIPDLMQRRRDERRINIWCAASSTGQEPYSLAMLLREHFPELARWNVSLIATDISRQLLDRARAGQYNQVEINRGLPDALLTKYFEQHGTDWRLNASIRRMVDFREINLARAWPTLPPMDLVLVRNVMIYFDVETKKTILSKLTRLMRPDAYLLLGGSETTFNLSDCYGRAEGLRSGFYRLAE